MKLQALASKPQLIKITIEEEDIVEKYGEPLEFWVKDRQDMDTFFKLANLEGGVGMENIASVVKDLVLDEKGNPILQGEVALPVDVMLKVIEVTVTRLGNSVTQTSAA